MNINELCQLSGEASLLSCSVRDYKVHVNLELYGGDKVAIEIEAADICFFDMSQSMNPQISTCHVELIELSKVLRTDNGFYVPSVRFSDMMNETRKKLNLAYGKKASENKYSFCIKGYEILFSCILRDSEALKIRVL